MRIDAPDDESAIWQPTDNIPPRDVIRTFMATRPTSGKRFCKNEELLYLNITDSSGSASPSAIGCRHNQWRARQDP